MLGILLDAVVLMFLLKAMSDEDVGFGTAILVALGASIGTGILAFGLISVMGLVGLLLAGLIGATLVGVVVSALFGMEIKRAALVGLVFMVVHMGFAIAMQLAFHV